MWENIFRQQRNSDQGSGVIGLRICDYEIQWIFYAGDADYGLTVNSSLNTDQWYHVVWTKNHNICKVYLNNIEQIMDNSDAVDQASESTNDAYIGVLHDGYGFLEFFDGVIDDIRIYNRALSESEIQELYLEGEDQNDNCEDSYKEGYEAGKQYCIDFPEECGLRPAKAVFTGELAEEIQSYLVLTENSVPFYLSPGSYVQAFGSDGMNMINVEEYARLQCKNFVGENEINIEQASSEFTVYRSGATVYLNSVSGTRVEIAATETPQILRFSDGSLELAIITGNVMLGSQLVDETEQLIDSLADENDTSESIF